MLGGAEKQVNAEAGYENKTLQSDAQAGRCQARNGATLVSSRDPGPPDFITALEVHATGSPLAREAAPCNPTDFQSDLTSVAWFDENWGRFRLSAGSSTGSYRNKASSRLTSAACGSRIRRIFYPPVPYPRSTWTRSKDFPQQDFLQQPCW